MGVGDIIPGEISARCEASFVSSDIIQPPALWRKLFRKTRVHNPPLLPAVTVNNRSQEIVVRKTIVKRPWWQQHSLFTFPFLQILNGSCFVLILDYCGYHCPKRQGHC